MPGTTPNGLPYPSPTDPIADGADAIRKLAEAIHPGGWLVARPASVVAANGSIVINPDGSVTASGSTDFSLDGVFAPGSSTIHRVFMQWGSGRADQASIQFRKNAAQVASGKYGYGRIEQALAVLTGAGVASAATAIPFANIPAGGGLTEMTISNAGSTARKFLSGTSDGINSHWRFQGSYDDTATVADGFRISGMAATILTVQITVLQLIGDIRP